MIKSADWEAGVGRRLRLRDLHILSAVAQWGSMAQAAINLGMSQPSISEAIANLEGAIGVQLLERSRKGVELTMYGEALLLRSRAAFDELRQGVRDIESLSDPAAGEIRIACPETLAAGLLPAIIDRLSRKHPRIVFHVVQTNATTVLRDLRERKVDLAMARLSKSAIEDDLEIERLFEDRLLVVAGAQNPLTRRRKIKLSELKDEAWITIPQDSVAGSFVAEAFRTGDLVLQSPTVVTFSQHVSQHLLAKGRYLTILPTSVLRFNSEYFSLKALPVEIPARTRPVAIVTLKNRLPSPVTKLFVDCAREVTKPMLES